MCTKVETCDTKTCSQCGRTLYSVFMCGWRGVYCDHTCLKAKEGAKS